LHTREVSAFWDDLVSCQGELSRLLEEITSRAADAVGEASGLSAYTEEDLRALESLAERATLALAEARRDERVLSYTDLHAIFEHSLDGILLSVPDGRVLAANPAACEILGMSEEQICLRGRAGLLPGDEAAVQRAVAQRAKGGRVRAEVPMIRGDGTTFVADLTSAIFPIGDGELRSCVIFRDVSSQVAKREQLEEQRDEYEQLSEHDELTGLLNRRGLTLAARRMFDFADRELRSVQVVYCDVDDLKGINDRHGHQVGDEVIGELADSIRASIRAVDVAARIGGDELVVLLFGASPADATRVTDRVAKRISRRSSATRASFSAGRAERPPGTTASLDELLAEADRKMYDEKVLRRLR
jgi:diguanylate cyclase (GGDEF)-like protein/PAS domain S-box-containing protein